MLKQALPQCRNKKVMLNNAEVYVNNNYCWKSVIDRLNSLIETISE